MDEEKSVLGIPEKPFSFAGLDGNGNNVESGPIEKADAEDKEDGGDDEAAEGEMKKKSSALDQSFAQLKSVIATAKSGEEVQAAFNALGQEVQNAYVPPAPSATDIAEIVRSAVEGAVAPLKMEIATLKAQVTNTPVQQNAAGVVRSKALNFNPIGSTNDPAALMQKAVPAAERPVRQLSQIEKLARKSTGLQG